MPRASNHVAAQENDRLTGGSHPDGQQRLAARLLRSRERSCLTQQMVADQTGIPRTAISDIERGRRRVDSLELKLLASVYGQSVEYLLDIAATRRKAAPLTSLYASLDDADQATLLSFARFLRHEARTADDRE